MARTLVIVAALLGLVTGWMARGKFAPVIEEVRAADPMVSILRQALARADARAVAITAQSRQALDSFDVYKRRAQGLLRAEQRAETVFVAAVRDSRIENDSLAKLCSVVILTCQQRAELADSMATVLRRRLEDQVGLQPKRVFIGAFLGPPVYDWATKKFRVWPPVTGVGVLLKLR